MTAGAGVAGELFDLVTEYSGEITSGSRTIDDPLGRNHPLIYFSGIFLEQFSAAHCRQNIVGLNDRSSRQLLVERRRLRGRRDRPATLRLIYQLEKFCKQVGEFSYSSSENEAEEFHIQYFPVLLERIVLWLAEADAEQDVRDSARRALTSYSESVGLR